MLLYHGTSAAVGTLALAEGLKTRESTGRASLWPAHPSHARAVYLTNAYALYFALVTLRDPEPGAEVAVVEVRVDEADLMPDEDALEQTQRGRDGLAASFDITKRTAWYRRNLHKYRGLGARSIAAMGTAAHWGDIPAARVTRVAFVAPERAPGLCLDAMDPTITVLNYQVVGAKYRALTARLFTPGTEGVRLVPGPGAR